MITVIKHGH